MPEKPTGPHGNCVLCQQPLPDDKFDVVWDERTATKGPAHAHCVREGRRKAGCCDICGKPVEATDGLITGDGYENTGVVHAQCHEEKQRQEATEELVAKIYPQKICGLPVSEAIAVLEKHKAGKNLPCGHPAGCQRLDTEINETFCQWCKEAEQSAAENKNLRQALEGKAVIIAGGNVTINCQQLDYLEIREGNVNIGKEIDKSKFTDTLLVDMDAGIKGELEPAQTKTAPLPLEHKEPENQFAKVWAGVNLKTMKELWSQGEVQQVTKDYGSPGPWRAATFAIYSGSDDIIGHTGGWTGKTTAKKEQDAKIQAAGRAFLDACMTRRGGHMYVAGFLRWVAEYRCKDTPAEFEAIGYAEDLEKAINHATGQEK